MSYDVEHMQRNHIEIDSNGFFICPWCSRSFRALAYHTTQVHKTDARTLRLMFGLPNNYPLQTKELKETRRRAALENKMDEQLKSVGRKTRFYQGFKQSQEMTQAISRGHMKNSRMVIQS